MTRSALTLVAAVALAACSAPAGPITAPAPPTPPEEAPMIELIQSLVSQLARSTSARDLAASLGYVTPSGDAAFTVRANESRLGTLRVTADGAGVPLQIEVTLPSRAGLTVNELKKAFGAWKEVPKVSWTSPPTLAFPWVDDKAAPATVALFARLSLGAPVSDAALVEGLQVRRDAR